MTPVISLALASNCFASISARAPMAVVSLLRGFATRRPSCVRAPYHRAYDPAITREVGRLHAEVVLLDELVLAKLVRAPALELDLAVHDDVAAIRDLRGLVEVLLRHEHGELALLLELLD